MVVQSRPRRPPARARNYSAAWIASRSPTDRKRLLAALGDREAAALLYDWRLWARDNQLPPEGDWRGWLIMSGRGWGKTRVLVEWVREPEPGRPLQPGERIALIGPTAADVRDVLVEGESGILATSPPWDRPTYEPSKRRLTWPNGAMATLYSADEPDRLRGPQHHRLAADEIAAWRYPEDAWSNAMFGLRLGNDPRWAAATTPKPIKLIRELLQLQGVTITRGSTYENRANLADAFLEEIVRRYEGTRLGRQELEGELLEDIPGALWSRRQLDSLRLSTAPDLVRVVVAIDPAMTSGDEADETGIVVAGLGADGQGYVLDDLSCRLSPDGWARRAVTAFHSRRADRIVAEVNNGGDMVELTVRTVDRNVPYRAVHASRGKRVRAEPIAALYEQQRIHHAGTFEALEDQMVSFTPETTESPDRVDALVWALSDLMLQTREPGIRALN